ncbi:MAG: hypothetical protein HY816_02840 [Candidatus Wallbacteria bacterium]|nr:hypothetical protein [Candidatus Wallbacteria bacterium]
MGRIIPLRKESWFTRLWWGLWRWMRPSRAEAATFDPSAEPPVSPPWSKSQMQKQLLHSQRKVVDELRRLNQILARTQSTVGPASRTPPGPTRRKLRLLVPRLE